MNGTYKCTAKNKANTTSSSATLRVYGKFSYNDIDDDDDNDDDDDDDVDNDDDDVEDEGEKQGEKKIKTENELVNPWAMETKKRNSAKRIQANAIEQLNIYPVNV